MPALLDYKSEVQGINDLEDLHKEESALWEARAAGMFGSNHIEAFNDLRSIILNRSAELILLRYNGAPPLDCPTEEIFDYVDSLNYDEREYYLRDMEEAMRLKLDIVEDSFIEVEKPSTIAKNRQEITEVFRHREIVRRTSLLREADERPWKWSNNRLNKFIALCVEEKFFDDAYGRKLKALFEGKGGKPGCFSGVSATAMMLWALQVAGALKHVRMWTPKAFKYSEKSFDKYKGSVARKLKGIGISADEFRKKMETNLKKVLEEE
jgi:hypothetical protein